MISIAMELDAHDIAQEIRQERQVHKGSFLLLAGESDIKRFGKFVDQDGCSIQNCFSRQNLLEAIDILTDEGFSGVLGLADAEFDRIEGHAQSEGIIFSDSHDFDLDFIRTDSLHRYLTEVAHSDKCNELGGPEGVRAWLLEACKPLSVLRYITRVQDLGIRLDQVDYRQICIDGCVDVDLLAYHLSASQSNTSVDDLKSMLKSYVTQNFDLLQLTNGNDLSAMLGLALQGHLGDRKPDQAFGAEVKIHLRLTFSEEDFVHTPLFFAILGWEAENAPYVILKKQLAAGHSRVLH
jgi:hypothetical protein